MLTQQIDQGLASYYELNNVEYYNDGTGKFGQWCQDNGYDSDMLYDELNQDASDCALVDFDEYFPSKFGTDKERRSNEIHSIIINCFKKLNIYTDIDTNDLPLNIQRAIRHFQKQTDNNKSSSYIINKRVLTDVMANIQSKYSQYLYPIVSSYSASCYQEEKKALIPPDIINFCTKYVKGALFTNQPIFTLIVQEFESLSKPSN